MNTNLDFINQICIDLGGTGGHFTNVSGENEICTLLGGTGGHFLEIDALNEICTIQGVTAGHSLNLAALNAIGGDNYISNSVAWAAIQSGSVLNQNPYPAIAAAMLADEYNLARYKAYDPASQNIIAPDKCNVLFDILNAGLSDELLTGLTNSATNPYETGTISGLDITSAVNTTATGSIYSNTFTVKALQVYKVQFTLTLNSGAAPNVSILTGASVSASRSNVVVPVAGANTIYLIISDSVDTTRSLGFWQSNAGDWSLTGLTCKRLTGRHLAQPSISATKWPLLTAEGLTFDGAEDFMKMAIEAINQPVTIYTVLKQKSFTDGDYISDGNVFLRQKTAAGTLSLNAGSDLDNSLSAIDKLQVIVTKTNGANSALKVNKTETVTGDSGANNFTGQTIGSKTDGTVPANILLVERLIRNNADTEDQMTAMADYLINQHLIDVNVTARTSTFLAGLTRTAKPLIKIGVTGDSLTANALGGAIPTALDEGANCQPIRLDTNSTSRRIYDTLCWNKATHRMAAHANWAKSGTWAALNDITVWEPAHTATNYYKSVTANSYLEIVVPDGKENFALVCQKSEGFGKLNVTLNGGSIADYGLAQINLTRTNQHANDIGNPYHTVEYIGLPAGANTIRVSKENNTEEVRVWGGFYWSGNTLMVYNVAHGGHTLAKLYDYHLTADVKENAFDAVLFQLPIMNEASGNVPTATSQAELQDIITNIIQTTNCCFMSCNPFGLYLDTNYYTDYSTPDMDAIRTALIATINTNSLPYIDIFERFKQKIINRGGTLADGIIAGSYTIDGQHPNTSGVSEWWDGLRSIIDGKIAT